MDLFFPYDQGTWLEDSSLWPGFYRVEIDDSTFLEWNDDSLVCVDAALLVLVLGNH
mgnify:CR=1 FL=1